jgi:predicted transcriptional regulator
MGKEAVFTMKLESELRADFVAEAEAVHRPASQIMRELMREFITRQREQREQREYDEFLHRKVEVARTSVRAGRGIANEDVEADFATRRAEATREA